MRWILVLIVPDNQNLRQTRNFDEFGNQQKKQLNSIVSQNYSCETTNFWRSYWREERRSLNLVKKCFSVN